MKVAMIWHSTYPWDIRIEKFVNRIVEGGNEVLIVSKGRPGLPGRERRGKVTIERVRFRLPLLGRVLSLPVFFNPFWIAAAALRIRRERAGLVIVRDLPLALPFALLRSVLKVSVLLDMAENYPAALLAYRNPAYAPFLFADAWLPRQYEKLALRYLSHVIVVTEEQKERLTAMGYPEWRVTIVGNTPDCGNLDRFASSNANDLKGKRYILYSGFMDPHRGLRTLLLAFNEIKDVHPDCRLVLIGRGSEERALRKLAGDCGLADRVIFKGWIDFHLIPAYIRDSSLCVIPHLRTEHTETTMPNKIYDYLFFGRPVVVSDAGPLKRMVREFGCGAVFASGDYRGLGRILRRFLEEPYPGDVSRRSRRLVETKYNWTRDGAVLMRLIERYGY